MLVDRQIVRGFSYPKVAANDEYIEFELCVEQDLEFYQNDDEVLPVTYIEAVAEHYILNGDYVDIDELRISLGAKYKDYIADAVKNTEY